MALPCVTSQHCCYSLFFFIPFPFLSFSSPPLSHMENFPRLIPPVPSQGRFAEAFCECSSVVSTNEFRTLGLSVKSL